jgi:hypothetical protein
VALSYATTLRNTQLDDITTAVGNAGVLRLYSGSVPANVGTSLGAQVILAELTCGTPFAASASGGVLTAGSITQDSSANATGTASFFRLFTSGGTAVMQGTVTATGGGGDLTLTTTSITSGQPVQVTSFVITDGNA